MTRRAWMDATMRTATRVEALLAAMTPAEKVGQMVQYLLPKTAGDAANPDAAGAATGLEAMLDLARAGRIGSFLAAGRVDAAAIARIPELQRAARAARLGIPLLIGADAIHGAASVVGGAVFPVSLNQAATFDEDAAQAVAQATARQLRACCCNWNFMPNVEVARDMRWGRVGETFGEDPLLVARLGAAQVRGHRAGPAGERVASCAKHFIAGSRPIDGRNHSPADLSENSLREILLPPFAACIAAGAETVMLAHNEVNGQPCHGSRRLITDLLKGELGFTGFTVSDWLDVGRLHSVHRVAETPSAACELSVSAGLDMNMHGPGFFEPVLAAVAAGRLDQARLDDAVRRILRVKFELGLFDAADDAPQGGRRCLPEDRTLALDVARRSLVLLEDGSGVLPLDPGAGPVVLAGPLADTDALLGDWAAGAERAGIVTVRDGLAALLGAAVLRHVPCPPATALDDEAIARAVTACAGAAAAVVVVGTVPLRTAGPGRASPTRARTWTVATWDCPDGSLIWCGPFRPPACPRRWCWSTAARSANPGWPRAIAASSRPSSPAWRGAAPSPRPSAA